MANNKTDILGVSITDIYEANLREGTHCALKEMARGAWLLGPQASECKYLAAFVHGRVKDVWEIDKSRGKGGFVPAAAANRTDLPPGFEAERAKIKDPKLHLRKACFLIDIKDEDTKRGIIRRIGAGRLYGSVGYF